MLDVAIRNDKLLYTTEEVTKIAKKCNDLKYAARDAQDASQTLFLCCYLSTLPIEKLIVVGNVNKVGTRSVDVVVFQYGIAQTVWIEDILEETDGLEEKEGGIEVHWKNNGIQRIVMFSEVRLKIATVMNTSPPTIKLTLLPPINQ
jgi:exoribonuclease R